MVPMLIFLQRNLPSSPARVMQLSCIATDRAFTDFQLDQALQEFPPAGRFPFAHIQTGLFQIRAENGGLVRFDESRITRRTRPRTGHATFTASGANKQIPRNWRFPGVGFGNPESITLCGETSGYGRGLAVPPKQCFA